MKNRPKKEIEWIVTHKGALNLQKIERDKWKKRREDIREKAIALQIRMVARVTEHDENLSQSSHDR